MASTRGVLRIGPRAVCPQAGARILLSVFVLILLPRRKKKKKSEASRRWWQK